MFRPLFAAAALTLFAATPAFAGPPWISLEIPANPYNETTRGAFALVRVYHHGDVAYYPVSGKAEGLVNGARQSVDLNLVSTSIPGVYALRYEPKKEGAWLLVINLGQKSNGEMGQATMLVQITNGEIGTAQVPTKMSKGYLVPDAVTPAQVDAMLRQQLAVDDSQHDSPSSPIALAGLALFPLGLLVTMRRR
jgi:hypothetical protein